MNLLEIPGYREAVREEQASRDATFIDAPEQVAGFHLQPFTLRKFMALQAVHHPLLSGQTPTPDELIQFLWFCNPHFGKRIPASFALAASRLIPPNRPASNGFWGRVRLRKQIRALKNAAAVLQAVRDWLDEQFKDGHSSVSNGYSKEYWSSGIVVILLLAQNGLGNEQAILDMPMKRICAYLRCLRKMKNPKEILSNPSDRILNEWLKEQNQKARN